MELGATLGLLGALLIAAHAGGALFAWLRQPRVIGEIVGGALLGPTVFGAFFPAVTGAAARASVGPFGVLAAAHEVGLVLLMFLSGARMKELFAAEDRRAVAWLAAVGTAFPFVLTIAAAPLLPLEALAGTAGSTAALVLVLGIAAAVTSIPVISRIFRDLDVLHTRFARLVLGVAVVEDVALWAVLALATALAGAAHLGGADVTWHVVVTVAYVTLAIGFAPSAVRALERSPRNGLARRWPLAWLAAVLGAYAAVALACGVSLVFAAFFAGIALEGRGEAVRTRLIDLERVAYLGPIPLYFAVVGYRLVFDQGFAPGLVAALIAAACGVKLASVGLGGALAGFRGRDLVNLAIATNARGGPGIVLASVAYDAQIVNALGYTALVLLAVITSQGAGAWLERELRAGRTLLVGDVGPGLAPEGAPAAVGEHEPPATPDGAPPTRAAEEPGPAA